MNIEISNSILLNSIDLTLIYELDRNVKQHSAVLDEIIKNTENINKSLQDAKEETRSIDVSNAFFNEITTIKKSITDTAGEIFDDLSSPFKIAGFAIIIVISILICGILTSMGSFLSFKKRVKHIVKPHSRKQINQKV